MNMLHTQGLQDRAARFDEIATLLGAMDYEAWTEQATAFTCREAEALARIMRLVDLPYLADSFMECHAEGDEEGDDHWREI